ncbi:CaiB/BaiF CoA transferase family protein [Chloroflexota bacterium]
MKEALAGIRVLDCSTYKAGPTCAQILGDMGAEVIRVERIGGEEDRQLGLFTPDNQRLYLQFTCRNKKAITLNLREARGQELLKKLVEKSDIVVENFGPVVNKKLGLNYTVLKAIKKDIIVVAISAYGQDGPYAQRLGYDSIAQAMCGLMYATGFPGSPPVKLNVAFIDTAGGVYGALGATFALFHRQRNGEGQLVDISLLDSAVSFMESTYAEHAVCNQIRPQVGNSNILCAPYDAYQAKDGYFFFGVVGNKMWRRFLKTVGWEDLDDNPRFDTEWKRAKEENRRYFTERVNQWAADKTVAEVVKILNDAFVPCGPVNTIPQAAEDPQIKAREMIVELEHPGTGKIPLIGIPVKLSATPGQIKTPAPTVGEHNQEVYGGLLGLNAEELQKLQDEGII